MKSLSLFRFIFAASRRINDRVTLQGMGLATLTLFAGAFGLDTKLNYAHGLFSLGAMLLLVDFLACRRLQLAVEVRRVLPDFVTVDQTGYYTLQLHNGGTRRLTGMMLVERLQQPFPTLEDVRARASGKRRKRGGGFIRYPHWLDAVRRLRCLDIKPIAIPDLNPGQSVDIRVAVSPTNRGLAIFEALWLYQPAPLGLCQSALRLPDRQLAVQGQTLAVLPKRLALALLPLVSHRHLQPGGVSQALRVGDSEEFRSLRDYRPGDPLRAVHWRSWARTGRPVVREYHDEFFSRHALLLDTEEVARFDPAFETAVSIAATLVAQPLGTDSLLDMLFVADRVHRLTAGRGLGTAAGLLRVLATVQPSPADSFAALARVAVQGASQIGSLLCVFLRWDEPRRQFVLRMQALGVTPMVFVVTGDAAMDQAASHEHFPLQYVAANAAGEA